VELEEAGGGGESLLCKFQFWSPMEMELNQFNTYRKGAEVGNCTSVKWPIGSGRWRRCLIDASKLRLPASVEFNHFELMAIICQRSRKISFEREGIVVARRMGDTAGVTRWR
jgi:hypothetical protein